MPLDPKAKTLLDNMAAMDAKPLWKTPIAESRRMVIRMTPPVDTTLPLAAVTDRTLPGPGGQLPIRIYTPHGTAPHPVVLFFHGGGFVMGNLDTHDHICRNLCVASGCMILSVDYRLAPEHRFPAACDDCMAAVRWVAANGSTLNADPNRIAVAGDSAGANLSTVTALRIRDEGGPALGGQVLLYPVTDHHSPGTASMRENDGLFLNVRDMVWFSSLYRRDDADIDNPYVHPLRAARLSGLPPALVITAECDPLRDEGEAYADRLKADGVSCTLKRYPGMVHAFAGFINVFPQAKQAIGEAATWLKERLA